MRGTTAVARIYEAKGRPSFNPLIVHLPDLAAVERIAEVRTAAGAGGAFWPGAADAGAALRARRLRPLAARHGGLDDGGGPHARASGGAGAACAFGGPLGRAFGQPLGPGVADPRRPCAGRADGPDRGGAGRRPLRGGGGIHHRGLADPAPCSCAPAAFRSRRWRPLLGQPLATGGDAGGPPLPASLPRIMRPRPWCG
jgi:L-threonylcarbamoyladenylate synthase